MAPKPTIRPHQGGETMHHPYQLHIYIDNTMRRVRMLFGMVSHLYQQTHTPVGTIKVQQDPHQAIDM